MDWFYALNGRQNGPVTEAGLDELHRTGIINQDTLVWHSGLADWQPLRSARPMAPPVVSAPGAPAMAACAECRRPFSQSEMIQLNNSWVCAECKPVFLQRMREGSAPEFGDGVWRYRNQLVVRPDASLPDRCVRCNAPANGYRLKRKLWWHPPAYYALILLYLLIYVVVAILVRRKAVLMVGLCERHRNQRSRFIITGWLLLLGGFAVLIVGGSFQPLLILVGLLAMLGGLVVAMLMPTRIVYPTRITRDLAWVKGAGSAFLADLPEWNG